jgi:hypothetical protein
MSTSTSRTSPSSAPKLRLRVEVLAEHTESLGHSGWMLLTIEAHAISKIAALLDRPDSEKGFKDARETLRLLEHGVDAGQACRILAAASASPAENLPGYIATAFDLLGPRADASKEQRERIRHWRREWITAISATVQSTQRARPTLE